MTLYTISFVLLFFACAAEAYRKHGLFAWSRVPTAIALSAVLALPVMLPLVLFLILAFDVDIREKPNA